MRTFTDEEKSLNAKYCDECKGEGSFLITQHRITYTCQSCDGTGIYIDPFTKFRGSTETPAMRTTIFGEGKIERELRIAEEAFNAGRNSA